VISLTPVLAAIDAPVQDQPLRNDRLGFGQATGKAAQSCGKWRLFGWKRQIIHDRVYSK
jgi:hypothetical protein